MTQHATIQTSASLIRGMTRPVRRVPLLARLAAWHGVWQQRRILAQMDDARLEDIGLTRAEARHEAARPVWDVPATWLK